jgi:TPR repeat protein
MLVVDPLRNYAKAVRRKLSPSELALFEAEIHMKAKRYGDAFSALELVAEEKDPAVLLQLAIMHKNGLGTYPDLQKARKFLSQAAKAGSKQAVQKLKKLDKENPPQPFRTRSGRPRGKLEL